MVTKGYNACYLCMDQIHARHSVPLHKIVFDEFRRYLDELHPFRTELKDLFNGYIEQRPCLIRMTAKDWISRWNGFIDS
jgi:hypothetical protein